jgi:hypothetical protein
MTDSELDAFVAGHEAPTAPPSAQSPHDESDFAPALVRPLWHRPVLTILVVGVLAWLCWPLTDELAYHFSGQQKLDLGDVSTRGATGVLPENRYVGVSGILGNKAATVKGRRQGALRFGPIQVRQMLGAPIWVEFDQDAKGDRFSAFTRVALEGRLVGFGPGTELEPVRAYFKKRHGVEVPAHARLLLLEEAPGGLWRYPIFFAACGLVALFSVWSTVGALRARQRPFRNI